jgi:hypothetical protein
MREPARQKVALDGAGGFADDEYLRWSAAAENLIDRGGPKKFLPARSQGFPDDDTHGVMLLSIFDDCIRDRSPADANDAGSCFFSLLKDAGQTIAVAGRIAQPVGGLDVDDICPASSPPVRTRCSESG